MKIKPTALKMVTHKITITDKQIELILKDIEQYIPYKYAAESNGVTQTQFYNYIAQGICDLDFGDNSTRYARMVEALRKIEKKRISECLKDIRKKNKGHKGAEWILERCYWQTFSSDAKFKELDEEISRIKGEMNSARKEEAEREGNKEGA